MPVVQKFKRFVDDKRCKVPFFLYLWLTYRARGLWGGGLTKPISQPSTLLTPARLAHDTGGGPAPLLPAESGAGGRNAQTPRCSGLSLLGLASLLPLAAAQPVGAEAGALRRQQLRLGTKAETPPG